MALRRGLSRLSGVRTVVTLVAVLGLFVTPSFLSASLLSTSLLAAADAAPGDTPPPLSLDAIGAGDTITFPGQQGQVSLSLPVPDGLAPSALRGTTTLPPFVTGGFVDVLQQDRLVSRTPINAAPSAPIELPLPGITVDKRAADLVLRAYLRVDGICQFDPDNSFRIVNANVVYSGREAAPTTVADFLPPVLRKLTIYVPDDVAQAEGSAAVNLATAVVGRYGTAPVGVQTASLPRSDLVPTDRPGALERQIVVSTSAPDGLTLRTGPGGPYLLIGGPAANLIAQTRLLTSDLAPIAMASSAVAGQLFNAPQLPPAVHTLADLGVTNQSVTSASWPSVAVGIDQTRLGRPSKNIRVQFVGTYTPTPGDVGGQLSVRLGDKVIDTWTADSSGTFNRWVSIPDADLARFMQLTLTLSRGDDVAGCGNGFQSSLSLDSSGEVTSDPADPPIPSGFGSLPQALMPRLQLGWTTGDVADVSRAVTIMAGMQRLSAAPLGVDVVPVSDVLSSDQPGVVIAANGSGLPQLSLPVYSDGRTVNVVATSGEKSQVTLSPGLAYGSLQVARDDDRTLLVATSTNLPAGLDDTLAWLSAEPDRWAQISGTAMIKTPGRDPVFVVDAAPAQQESTSDDGVTVSRAIGVAAIVVLALGALAWLFARRRRSGPRT